MRDFPSMFFGIGIGAELIYSFIIIVCSLMIYFGTRELYELSKYKGIKYFRLAFLFFAIAYFFRSFIKFIMMYFDIKDILDISPRFFGNLTLFIFMYFSSLAIFYLLYSVMWKKWNGHSKKIVLFHLLALAIASISILSRNPVVYFALNLLLFIFISIIVYTGYKDSKKSLKSNNLFFVYLLLFIFWILNIIDILIPRFLEMFNFIIYLISSGIFMLILYKVLRRAGE